MSILPISAKNRHGNRLNAIYERLKKRNRRPAAAMLHCFRGQFQLFFGSYVEKHKKIWSFTKDNYKMPFTPAIKWQLARKIRLKTLAAIASLRLNRSIAVICMMGWKWFENGPKTSNWFVIFLFTFYFLFFILYFRMGIKKKTKYRQTV